MKKLLKGSIDRFVLNLLKGSGMVLSCAFVSSCNPDNKKENQDDNQKSAFADKEEMIRLFIEKGLSREEAEKKVTDEFFEENKNNKDAFESVTLGDLLDDTEALQGKINEKKKKIGQEGGGDGVSTSQEAPESGESTNNETPSLKLGNNECIKDGKYLPIEAGSTENCVATLKVVVAGYDDSIHEVVSRNGNVKITFDKDNSSIGVGIANFNGEILVSTEISLREKNGQKEFGKFDLCLVDETYKNYWEGSNKSNFTAVAKKCVDSANIGDLKGSLKDLESKDDNLLKVWGAIEGEKFRNDLSLSLQGNKLSWKGQSVEDVKGSFENVVDALVAYNTVFPDNVVKFVLDETNIDLSVNKVVDSLTKLVELKTNVEGQIWVGKNDSNNRFAFCVKNKTVGSGEWDSNIGGLKNCVDSVVGIKDIAGINETGFCSVLFSSVVVANGTTDGQIKVGIGDFVLDDCVNFKNFDDLGAKLVNVEGVVKFVGKCFSFSFGEDNTVSLKVNNGAPMKILTLESENTLQGLEKLIAGTENWFTADLENNKITLAEGDRNGEVKIGEKSFSVTIDSKDSFDGFVSSVSSIGKYWGFNGNFGSLSLGRGVLLFGKLDISIVGKVSGFFVGEGSWKKAVGIKIVGNNGALNNVKKGVENEDNDMVVFVGNRESCFFKFDEIVWAEDNINSNVLGGYFIKNGEV